MISTEFRMIEMDMMHSHATFQEENDVRNKSSITPKLQWKQCNEQIQVPYLSLDWLF